MAQLTTDLLFRDACSFMHTWIKHEIIVINCMQTRIILVNYKWRVIIAYWQDVAVLFNSRMPTRNGYYPDSLLGWYIIIAPVQIKSWPWSTYTYKYAHLDWIHELWMTDGLPIWRALGIPMDKHLPAIWDFHYWIFLQFPLSAYSRKFR